eukprot:350255-Chlamydomonas_euryale.AAC.32
MANHGELNLAHLVSKPTDVPDDSLVLRWLAGHGPHQPESVSDTHACPHRRRCAGFFKREAAPHSTFCLDYPVNLVIRAAL